MNRTLIERVYTYLGGMDARDWAALLRENRFAVDPEYWPRAAWATYASVRTSLLRAREDRRYARVIAAMEVYPPLFVLGSSRSGTTHLHRLLSLDERFTYPKQYQAMHPHTFLSADRRLIRRMAAALYPTRPMDNVTVDAHVPAEDEHALALLTRCSPYLERAFPRHREHYHRHRSFRAATPEDLARWKAALVWFLCRVPIARQLCATRPPLGPAATRPQARRRGTDHRAVSRHLRRLLRGPSRDSGRPASRSPFRGSRAGPGGRAQGDLSTARPRVARGMGA
ncbi:MAG: sulfotransferase [Chloroflexi bacterium]|nr:sulfotransferase [Chloroflexota bacterium]